MDKLYWGIETAPWCPPSRAPNCLSNKDQLLRPCIVYTVLIQRKCHTKPHTTTHSTQSHTSKHGATHSCPEQFAATQIHVDFVALGCSGYPCVAHRIRQSCGHGNKATAKWVIEPPLKTTHDTTKQFKQPMLLAYGYGVVKRAVAGYCNNFEWREGGEASAKPRDESCAFLSKPSKTRHNSKENHFMPHCKPSIFKPGRCSTHCIR